MSAFCERLRAAREATGLNQQNFGALGGVSRNAQFTYESGKRAPDAEYLMALASRGIDSGYILTGRRGDDSLSENVTSLVGSFEGLSPSWQAMIAALVAQAAGSVAPTGTASIGQARIILPGEEALVEMFEALLMTIDQSADRAEQALLLARRLPIGLSQLEDLLPPEDQPTGHDLAPATAEGRATRRHAPTGQRHT